jgi:hypothetical protein
MGFPIVLCTSEIEPHTSSHHISIFPNGLLGHIISVLLTTPQQDHYPSISCTISFPIYRLSSIHLPNTETHPWGPHPPPVLFHNLHPNMPIHLSLGHPFLYLYTQPKLFFIYLISKILCFQHLLIFFIISLDGLLLSWKRNPCHPWLGNPLYFHTDIVHKPEVSQVHIPMISEFVHFVIL